MFINLNIDASKENLYGRKINFKNNNVFKLLIAETILIIIEK